ncbi:GTP-binding protein [Microbacterium marinilacus]|uniref:GTP-binding protein n=1 Tax=Microbacterium marinilacus TaxID=415209 RepID=UPI0027E1208A|nr:GTP-binding protein [Microbacterium marinilacus]
MDAVGVIAVVGACGPERLRYAKRLAKLTNRGFFPASRLAGSPDPAQEAAVLSSWTNPAAGAVVELPDEVPATELIGTFGDFDDRTRLLALVCVVDAAHMLDDLHRDDYLPLRDADSGVAAPLAARAQLTVTQIEYASAIVLVNWKALTPPDLAVVMALLNHLSPHARLRLHRDAIAHLEPGEAYGVEQDRPGWVCFLNDDFDPHMTDPRVSAFRYEQVRPLHPGRFKQLLDDRIEPGEFGDVLRSAGFCRLATRASIVAQWEHVGRVISLNPLAIDDRLEDEEELLALGQDLAFVGLDLDHDGLVTALDEAALTDAEIAAGPTAWGMLPGPFPAWAKAADRSE